MIGSVSSYGGGLSNALIEIQSRAIQPAYSGTKTPSTKTNSTPSATSKSTTDGSTSTGSTLSSSEEAEVAKLKSRDAEVHAHEQAHIAAGGSLIRGGPSYEYTTGPDNKRYATGGEVSIDSSPVKDDPEATIRKGERVKRAALAPAKPSSQDYSVASAADQMVVQAQMELAREKMQATQESGANGSQNTQKVIASNAYQASGKQTNTSAIGIAV
jgi:hypothetical protein